MQAVAKYINSDNTYVKIIITIGAIAVAASAIANIISIYPNLRPPKISIKKVDYETGYCQLTINGKERELFGNSTLNAGGDWGVRFGTKLVSANSSIYNYDAIELVKNEKVQEIISKKAIV